MDFTLLSIVFSVFVLCTMLDYLLNTSYFCWLGFDGILLLALFLWFLLVQYDVKYFVLIVFVNECLSCPIEQRRVDWNWLVIIGYFPLVDKHILLHRVGGNWKGKGQGLTWRGNFLGSCHDTTIFGSRGPWWVSCPALLLYTCNVSLQDKLVQTRLSRLYIISMKFPSVKIYR